MKRSTIMVLIVFLIILFLGIFLFYQAEEPVEYKTFQKEGFSFKYPSDWKDYTADIPEEDILVAMGDPETVGFQNMSIPTTMIVIKKSVIPINSTSGSEYNFSDTMMTQDLNNMQMLESQANNSSSLFWDTLKSSVVNVTQGNLDFSTMINALLSSFFMASSSYSGMNYDVQNITIDGINAQEFTFQGKNGYSQENEYARIITFESRNDTEIAFYVIMCSARGSDMESASEQFDTIIESLKIN
jgi:hypothetical protein